jgi:hypothetical protein
MYMCMAFCSISKREQELNDTKCLTSTYISFDVSPWHDMC